MLVMAVRQQVAVRPLQVVHQPASHLIKPSPPHRLRAAHLPKHHHLPAAHPLRHHHERAPHVTATHLRQVVLLHRLRHSHQGTYSTLVVPPTGQYLLCQMVAVPKSFPSNTTDSVTCRLYPSQETAMNQRCISPPSSANKVSDVCLHPWNWVRIFRGGVQVGESATYFSRPTPPRCRSQIPPCQYRLRGCSPQRIFIHRSNIV